MSDTANPFRRIRRARVDEAAALSELCFRSKAVWGYDEPFMRLCRNGLKVVPEQIAGGDVWVVLAAGGSIGGVVELASTDQPDTLDLGKLFVEPQQIRSGFGRILLAHAVAEARRRGARRLTILADPNAAAFYERHGARNIGQGPSDAIPGRLLPLYEIVL